MSAGYREDAREDRSVLVVAFAGQVFGLEPRTGSIVWEHALNRHRWGEVEVLVQGGRVFATDGRELHCLDYRTGSPIGRVVIPDRYKGRPSMVIEGDRIFVASQGEVTCFSVAGDLLWAQEFSGKGMGAVALGFPGNLRQADDAGTR